MLAKDPAARPASVGEAFRALEQAALRAGVDVPTGLLRLPRPSKLPEAPDPERSTERPTGLKRDHDGRSLEGSARLHDSTVKWVAIALVVATGLLGIWFVTRRPEASSSEQVPSATATESAVPKPEAPAVAAAATSATAAGEPSAAGSASAAPSAVAPAATTRRAPKRSATPTDLENPF